MYQTPQTNIVRHCQPLLHLSALITADSSSMTTSLQQMMTTFPRKNSCQNTKFKTSLQKTVHTPEAPTRLLSLLISKQNSSSKQNYVTSRNASNMFSATSCIYEFLNICENLPQNVQNFEIGNVSNVVNMRFWELIDVLKMAINACMKHIYMTIDMLKYGFYEAILKYNIKRDMKELAQNLEGVLSFPLRLKKGIKFPSVFYWQNMLTVWDLLWTVEWPLI